MEILNLKNELIKTLSHKVQCAVVDIFQLVVGGCGCWQIYFGWWWVVMARGEWQGVVTQFSLSHIKISKQKLACKDFYHEICLFSHQSKNIFCQSVLLSKFRHQRSKYCFSIAVSSGSRTPATSTNGEVLYNSLWLQVDSYCFKNVPFSLLQGSQTHLLIQLALKSH